MADEQRVPGTFAHHPDRKPMGGIGAAIEILGEKLLVLRMVDEVGLQPREAFRRERAIVVPPDRAVCRRIAHDEFVIGRPPGMPARRYGERAMGGNPALSPGERMLIEF